MAPCMEQDRRSVGGEAAARPLGRPKDLEKRRAILAAARDLFAAHGVAAVSMEAVAAAAGVSKVTVYGHFQDKPTLFEATVRAKTEDMATAMEELVASERSLAETLPAFGTQLLTFLSRPDLIAFDRLLSGEAHRHPEIAARFYEAGPGRVCDILRRLIAAGARRGEVAVDDPALAAEDLAMLWLGMAQIRMRLGVAAPLDAGEVEARVRRGTRLFLAAFAPAKR